MRQKSFVVILLAAIAVLFSGCGNLAQKGTELMAERALKESGSVNADVKIDEDGLMIESEEGSVQVGESASLPKGFPDDVYVLPGKIMAAFTSNENNGFTVSIQTNEAIAELKALYEEKLGEKGWILTDTMDMGSVISIMGEKDERNVSVTITSSDEMGSVMIAVMDK